jgi:hypothetical protein
MNKALGSVMLLLGLSGALMAQVGAVPEVNASNGASALALLAGVVLVYQTRRRK